METVLSINNFENEVFRAQKIVLVDFWATWCGPCAMIAPIISEITSERNDIKVCKVDVDCEPELAEKFGIQYIPTLIVFKSGSEFKRKSGYMSKNEILSML